MTSNSPTMLYSSRNCHYCQRVRLALREKRIPFEMTTVDGELDAKMLEINPYGKVPILVDRDLTLFFPDVILEYLEERYPHPPLMPEVPMARARLRTYMRQIDLEWGNCVDKLAHPGYSRTHVLKSYREQLRQSVLAIAPIFVNQPYYMSQEMSLLDCCALPILWRLPILGVEISRNRQTRAMLEYIDRMKDTQTFQDSLTDEEKVLIQTHTFPD